MNNIEKLISFFEEDANSLMIINQVNEEIHYFYLAVIIFVSQELNIKLAINNDVEDIEPTEDLFEKKKIYIINSKSKKIISRFLNTQKKSILFTDYSNFKANQSKCNSINGYNYTLDIKYYLKEKLKILNDNFITSIINDPQSAFSEISKYMINSNSYLKDLSVKEKTNFILEIRKSIYMYKKDSNLQKMFLKIKEEAAYKKFSFLTY